jgi:hypothetical protein
MLMSGRFAVASRTLNGWRLSGDIAPMSRTSASALSQHGVSVIMREVNLAHNSEALIASAPL